MKQRKGFIRRYLPAFFATAVFVAFILAYPHAREKANCSLLGQLSTMVMVIPPIFFLMGLLDVWVPRETLISLMGSKSGFRGKIIAFALGSMAVGPLYGAFPVAAVLMKKGASFDNILVFMGAWSTTKIPMLLFEIQSVGLTFALSRLIIDIPGIVIIALAVRAFASRADIDAAYERARNQQ